MKCDVLELRNALLVAANRYHELHLRILDKDPDFHVENESQFRALVEHVLKLTDRYDHDSPRTNDRLDWRRRNE